MTKIYNIVTLQRRAIMNEDNFISLNNSHLKIQDIVSQLLLDFINKHALIRKSNKTIIL